MHRIHHIGIALWLLLAQSVQSYHLLADRCGSYRLLSGTGGSGGRDRHNSYVQSITMSQTDFAASVLKAAFSIKPLFKAATFMARKSIKKQGSTIGVDWDVETKKLYSNMNDLVKVFELSQSSSIVYPEYYLKPFHAYDEGNLSWQSAIEVEPAALSVHARVYSTKDMPLDIRGDAMLREKYNYRMVTLLNQMKCRPIKNILDIGCSTGLSTMQLHYTYPLANIIGIDLSPFMIAVAKYTLETDANLKSAKPYIQYMHQQGENTEFSDSSFDLVTLSLVSHELPLSASINVFKEAFRILKSGGAFSLMDMDPSSESFIKLASNPFAFSAFSSTEPWLTEYVSMDLNKMLTEVGFAHISTMSNSPRHRTVVAVKA